MPQHKQQHHGFTLIELLVTLAIIGLLASLLVPAVTHALASGKSAACKVSLSQMQKAYILYLNDNEGKFFPWRVNTPEGTQWYWGLETSAGGSAEGERALDRNKAYLSPYLGVSNSTETCPAFPRNASFYKQKYEWASYGYGLNAFFIQGLDEYKSSSVRRWEQITKPSQVLAWGDSIQINTWQSPASRANPLYEEWYYLNIRPPAKFHFRHLGKFNGAFSDGSVRSLKPDRTDDRLDGQSGYAAPAGSTKYLQPW
jgi:prepilin-type N-terminal cleavage/methylation domain-containing protein/prepilin-type processing-associated H-X9-DG protein